jgi:hypothetical protein
MPVKWSFTTLLLRLRGKQPYAPEVRELCARLQQYVNSMPGAPRPGRASARQAADLLAGRVLRRARSFDPSAQVSPEWLGQLIAELAAERCALLTDAGDLDGVIEQLRAVRASFAEAAEAERQRLEALARERVRRSGRFEDRTWEAYRLYDQEGRHHAAVAEELDIRPNTVFKYVKRVRTAVAAEVKRVRAEERGHGRGTTPL